MRSATLAPARATRACCSRVLEPIRLDITLRIDRIRAVPTITSRPSRMSARPSATAATSTATRELMSRGTTSMMSAVWSASSVAMVSTSPDLRPASRATGCRPQSATCTRQRCASVVLAFCRMRMPNRHDRDTVVMITARAPIERASAPGLRSCIVCSTIRPSAMGKAVSPAW